MKLVLLTFALFSTAHAGVTERGPDRYIHCESSGIHIVQLNSDLSFSLDANHPMMRSMVQSGILRRGYARDSGFARTPLTLVADDLMVDPREPGRGLLTKGASARILNGWDYDLEEMGTRENGREFRHFFSVLSRGQAAELRLEREVLPVTQCLRRERQEMYGQVIEVCVEYKVLEAGEKILLASAPVEFNQCEIR
jgi:hypothetical protein